MRKVIREKHTARIALYAMAVFLTTAIVGCQDGYEWAEEKPEWLGESIYDELERRGEFTIFLQMVRDLGRDEFLEKTGSVTVFAATDDAFRNYFSQNGFDENHLTPAQKKYFLNTAMLENAYVLDLLTNLSTTDGVSKGQVMRRMNTQWSIYDSIPTIASELLPSNTPNHNWWERIQAMGQPNYNIIPQGTQPMIHFLWRQMMAKGITPQDFSYLFGGTPFAEEDVYINNGRVREGNITCQNGYIHIMDGVPTPLPSMAAYMVQNGNTDIFARLIERFSIPLSANSVAKEYAYLYDYYHGQNLYSPLWGGDSIFYKGYLWRDAQGNGLTAVGNKKATGWLKFDPGRLDYVENGIEEGVDMGAIFAPTDRALQAWWEGDEGQFLRQRYPSEAPFDSVPDDVVAEFLNNHFQVSFLNTIPSRFGSVLNDAKDPIGLTTAAIVPGATAVCCNGALYVMNEVYAPSSFRSVIAPTLVEDNMKIMNWAIRNLEFKPYLLSMVSHYNYIILTDEALRRYVDPVTYNTDDPRWFEFVYNEEQQTVDAYTYSYDKKAEGDAAFTKNNMRPLTASEGKAHDAVSNRLSDLLNFTIVPRDIYGTNIVSPQTPYLITKDNGAIEIVERDGKYEIRDQVSGDYVAVTERVEKDNGYYLVADRMIQPTMQSLQTLLEANEEYSEFYELLLGNPEWSTAERNLYSIMKRVSSNTYSMNRNNTTVKTFNSYQYTVYVPDNAAMKKAYEHGLPRWSDINALTEIYAGREDIDVAQLKHDYTMRLLNFIKYHLQDHSVFIGGDVVNNNTFETAAYILDGPKEGLSYGLQVSSSPTDIVVRGNYIPDWTEPAVIEAADREEDYNQLIREYTFNGETYSSLISTSSFAVVHRISEPLLYDEECLCIEKTDK